MASQLRSEREAFLRDRTCPVLVWEDAPSLAFPEPDRQTTTLPSYRPGARASPEPLIYEVRPGLRVPASDDARVTVGRDAGCDIFLPHPTASRLHAFFRQDPPSGAWTITDAGSQNGTYLDGALILPGRSSPLPGRASLRFGRAELLFLQPAALEEYLVARPS
ncbi:FHA domain-containing protein [Pyxidicoccus parkwayensis]|uniref:FHA domain-containing protein n=1 Tax=Pyxidicoccus parkwayensis TaxID=2813578 RepID=A0ABX7PCD7_9BACT|nr:FHA domain-containing protein [Pyxidicoccus parkwaysis]